IVQLIPGGINYRVFIHASIILPLIKQLLGKMIAVSQPPRPALSRKRSWSANLHVSRGAAIAAAGTVSLYGQRAERCRHHEGEVDRQAGGWI
ncbi:MAG: hypothetical protein WCP55_22050, partial [Lentisphaerota bacterium]